MGMRIMKRKVTSMVEARGAKAAVSQESWSYQAICRDQAIVVIGEIEDERCDGARRLNRPRRSKVSENRSKCSSRTMDWH
jgi:hypothetical protein